MADTARFIWHDRDRFWTRIDGNGDSAHCAHKGDITPIHMTYPTGYDPDCGMCWLGCTHTEQRHNDAVLNHRLRSMAAREITLTKEMAR